MRNSKKISAKDYRFITNFKKEELKAMHIIAQAADIKGYVFVEKAYDAAGVLCEDLYALYFPINTTDRDIELFWQASGVVQRMIQEEE